MSYREILDAVKSVGDAAYKAQKAGDFLPEKKADNSYSTEHDRNSECILTDTIRALYPQDNIFGEEGYATPVTCSSLKYHHDDRNWFIDPIDGTHNFLAGSPFFSVVVSLQEKRCNKWSVIYAPALDICCITEEGSVATINGKPLNRPKVRSPFSTLVYDTRSLRALLESVPSWGNFNWKIQVGAHNLSCLFTALTADSVCLLTVKECCPYDVLAGLAAMTSTGLFYCNHLGEQPDFSTNQLIVGGSYKAVQEWVERFKPHAQFLQQSIREPYTC